MSVENKDDSRTQSDDLDFLLNDLPDPQEGSAAISIPADDLDALSAGREVNLDNLDIDLHDSALEKEMNADFVTEPQKNTGGISTGMILGIGAGFLVLVGCFAWFAISILSPGQQSTQGMAGIPDYGNADQVVDEVPIDESMMGFDSLQPQGQQLQAGSSVEPSPAAAPSGDLTTSTHSYPAQTAPQEDTDPLVVIYANGGEQEKNIELTNDILPQARYQAVAPGAGEISRPTEEELMYDKALASINQMGVPDEAVKIDETVIRRKLDGQKVERLEQELTQARSDVGIMRSAVSELQGQLSQLNNVVAGSTEKQDVISRQIESLAESVKSSSERQEQELQEMRNAIKAIDSKSSSAIDTAQKALNRAGVVQSTQAPVERAQPTIVADVSASVEKVASVSKPTPPAPAAQQKPVYKTPPPVQPIPKPVQVTAAVQPQVTTYNRSGFPEHCKGADAKVSANWRVKGVNKTSAYIVRVDGEGVYLKVDSPVSEFGVVLGFDPTPSERSVCTTVGLIRR